MRFAATVVLILCLPLSAEEKKQLPQAETGVLLGRLLVHTQGWGELGIDTCAYSSTKTALPLKIGTQEYGQGLGMHAPGELVVALEGAFERFDAEAGVQWQGQNAGSVVFQVFVDGEKQFDSGILRESDGARPVSVPLRGAEELRLVVTDAGDGITCDCANWANARLVPVQGAPQAGTLPRLDIAPFARVITCDPSRKDGVRATRVQPFPAEDLLLTREILPDAQGHYVLAPDSNGLAVIGLEWTERRMLRRVGLRFAGHAPDPAKATLQFWAGESPWQGEWVPVEEPVIASVDGWEVALSVVKTPALRRGTEKVRWVLETDETAVVTSVSAHTLSSLEEVSLRLEMGPALPGQRAGVQVYNGAFLAAGVDPYHFDWDLGRPAEVRVLNTRARYSKTDRTVLRFHLPQTNVAVAVQDVLEHGAVYVPEAGLFVSTVQNGQTLAEYQRQNQVETILNRVRKLPDQTLAQAFAAVHNPIQDNGPMMVSLACDNRKFVVEREGAITFEHYTAPDQEVDWPSEYRGELRVALGSGSAEQVTRHLEGGWLPVPVTETKDDGITYQQKTWVAPFDAGPIENTGGWLYERAACVIQITATNTAAERKHAVVDWRVLAERKSGNAAPLETVGGSLLAFRGEHVLAVLSGPALWDESGLATGAAVYHFDLAPGESTQVFAVLPAFPATAQDIARFSEPAASLDRVMAYWQEVLAPRTQIETPDLLLNNIVRASQVHCLLAARNEERGKYVAAYISADRYGPLESEAHSVIRGMDLLGAQEYARRALEYFVKRYAPEGHLTTGYTLMGTGWHLWTLAEHFQRTGDTAWLAAIAPDVARACGWVARECEKTKVNDARGAPLPEYGLVPPGVAADWNRFAYRFIQEGHYYAGLAQAAAALAAVGHPDAPALEQAAAALRGNVQRAYRLTQDNSPVLPLADGTWVRPYPGMLNCFGRIEDMIPGEDANRSWAYDVELGAHHLALLGVLDPQSREVGDMLDHMEDFWFLHSGMGDYPEERNRADWFNLGGWAKIQPYYARNAELYALRDDIKPFIRSYFNTIPTLLSLENLSFWEHFHNMGGWNKTHETGYFLAQTRTMFVMERGNELWLALFVPEQWFGPGQRVSVQQAPTTFGAVGFALMTDATGKELSAEISPPATSGGRPGERTRKPVEAIVLRLRPLGQHAPRDIQVAGAEVLRIDQATATVHLKPGSDLITLRVTL